MANQFVNLPAPAANGSGAAVDTSTFGALKTITVSQGAYPLPCSVIIEFSNEEVPVNWTPIVQLTTGERDVTVASRWMRATVTNYRRGGAPTVNLAGDDSGASFATLVATAADGTGAAVDTSTLPDLKTIHVAEDFKGVLNIEISEDAGVTWAELTSFYFPDYKTLEFTAEQMRVTRSGVPQNAPGLPVINIGATDTTGGGGATTQRQVFRYVADGTEAAIFTVTLPTPWSSPTEVPTYNVQLTGGGPSANTIKDAQALVDTFTLTSFDVEMAAPPEVGDVLMITVEDQT